MDGEAFGGEATPHPGGEAGMFRGAESPVVEEGVASFPLETVVDEEGALFWRGEPTHR